MTWPTSGLDLVPRVSHESPRPAPCDDRLAGWGMLLRHTFPTFAIRLDPGVVHKHIHPGTITAPSLGLRGKARGGPATLPQTCCGEFRQALDSPLTGGSIPCPMPEFPVDVTSVEAVPGFRRNALLGRWTPLPVLMTGTFLIVLDFFAVNVALPSIQRQLGAGSSAIEWIVAGYALTFATFLIAAGRLGDRIGRRRTLMIGFTIFTLASALCGLAPTATILIAARLVQGASAALISPSVLALVGVIYSGLDRARAIGVYATVMGLAAAGGQLIGGALIQADMFGLGWRTVFLINVPVGLMALYLARSWVPESRAERARPFDFIGLALFTVGLAALILPLVQGQAVGWPMWCWLSL